MRTKNNALMEKIIEFIEKSYSISGRSPTIREIADALQVSKSCVGEYLNEMEKRKLVQNAGGSRGIITLKMAKTKNSTSNLPVVGSIACGSPLLAEENIECYLPIPNEFLGNGEFFILRANGESMIDAGICDGDYVIIRKQENAEEGQIIVALIDDEATLKRYYLDKTKKRIRLHPENKEMKDMYFNSIIIQGVAVKVIKDIY
mgnify:FL=1